MVGKVRVLALLVLLHLWSYGPSKAEVQWVAGDYWFGSSVDEFSDQSRDILFTVCREEKEWPYEKASLAWRCMEDGENVSVTFGGKYLGGDVDNEVLVRYRIDKREASRARYWKLSTNHRAMFMPMGDVAAFTYAAKTGAEIVLEIVDPCDSETLRRHFSLVGLSQGVARLSCHRGGY